MATAVEKANFIEKIAPLIQAEAKKRGYKVCSPVIAQACCEGNFGQSSLAKNWNNHFGLKCGRYWTGKRVRLKTREEYQVGKLVEIYDDFRVFDSMEEGVKGYYDFISTKRYANLKTSLTPTEYTQNLKNDGYATSSKYVSTILKYIETYGLRKYDTLTNEQTNPYRLTEKLIKKGMRGESVKWVQYNLIRHGANIKCDGIFLEKTLAAVISFQQSRPNLKVDGLVGKYTIAELEK